MPLNDAHEEMMLLVEQHARVGPGLPALMMISTTQWPSLCLDKEPHGTSLNSVV